VLRKKLDAKGVKYTVNDSIHDMLDLGITQAPVLSVNGKFLPFTKAVEWINQYPTGGDAI